MAYVPNAQDISQPTGDKAVASAAPEFRTLKSFTNDLQVALAGFEAELAAILAGIGAGDNSAALAAALAASGGSNIVGFISDVTGAVPRTNQSKGRERRSIEDFGALGGINDDTTPFANAAAWAAALGKPAEILFTKPKYTISASPNWNVSHLVLSAVGQVEIACTGVGPSINVDGTAAWVYGFEMQGSWILTGNAAANFNATFTKVSHAKFGPIRGRESITAAIECKLLVCCEFDKPECSVNSDPGMVTKPVNGIVFDSLGGLASTANILFNPIMEGVLGNGLSFVEADFNTVIGGTSEGNAVRGVAIGTLAKGTRIIGIACEVNTTEDVLNQGVGTIIEGGYFSKKINNVGAKRARIRNVRCQDLVFDATSTQCLAEDIEYSAFAAGGAITDAGAGTNQNTIKRKYNVNLATFGNFAPREWANPVVAPAPITVGASPYTYTNATDFLEQIIVRSGTISLIEFKRGAATTNIGAANNLPVANIFTLMPGDQLKVTYSVLPEMVRLPM